MKILEVVQGSQEWLDARAKYHTASEAAAMLGFSPYMSRNDLLKQKALGIVEDVDSAKQYLFDKGHAAEAEARPAAEEIIGEDLFPCTGVDDAGWLLASFDAATMLGEILWEHKLWNDTLAALVDTADLPDSHWPQLEHQLLVSGAEKVLFMVSNGDKQTQCWYSSIPERRAQLIAGWRQFDKDLANYEHVEHAPQASGVAPDSLPALQIQVRGEVTASNLAAFKTHALAVFDGISTNLQTDQDFADADKTVKWCQSVEDKLDLAKEQALAQTASIDDLFRAIDEIKAQARAKRLELDKMVKARKESIRVEILAKAKGLFDAHAQQINSSLGKVRVPDGMVKADFAGAMKNKRTISSLHDAVDTELARAKIAFNEIADRIRLNLETLRADAAGYESLFADAQQLVMSENDHLQLTISSRISAHKAAEEARLEAERERIRAEEKAKAEADAAKVSAQRETAETEQPKQAAAIVQSTQTKTKAPPHPPTTRQIVATLCEHYGVSEQTVRQWILEMDLSEIAA